MIKIGLPTVRLRLGILLATTLAVQVHGATPTDELSAEQLTSKAAALLRQGRDHAALYWLAEAERHGAEGVVLHYNRGVAQQRLGQLEEALEAFERARVAAPEAPQVLYGLATTLQTADRHVEAVPLLQAAARAAPRHSEIILGLGQALAASGRVEEALDAFALASALDFSAVEPVYQAGELFLRQGDAARAALHFSRAAELDAGHAEARVGLGRARLLSGDAVGAVTVLEAAVALAPRNQQAYYLLSDACTKTGLHERREQAMAAFRRLSETARHLRQGVLLERQGKLEPALQAWQRSVAADSTNVKPLILSGDALLRLGEEVAAGTAFAAALALSPGAVRARYGLGRVHFLAGRPEEAAAAFTRVLEQEPDHLDANYHAGLAATRLGRQDAARRYLLRTLDVDPGHAQARAALASIPAR